MKEQKPLISIALCTYNGEKFLEAQLDSLTRQTYPNIEIVVADDCSTDNTWRLLRQFQDRYPAIRLYRNSENLGYQKNFENALRKCEGSFLLISDQDDIWTEDKVSKLYGNIGGELLIYHDSEFVDEDGNALGMKMSDRLHMVEGNDPLPFLFFNCVSGHSMMFRKELLTHVLPFPPLGVYDHYIAFIAAGKGSIRYYPECLVKHRQHQGNSTDILGRKNVKSRLQVTKERMARENAWLKICADAESHPASLLAREIYESGKHRTENYFNMRFAYLMWKHQGKLAFIPKNRSFKTLSYAIRQVWGIKAKSLVKTS